MTVVGEESIGMDAATGILLAVAGVESDTTVEVGMVAEMGL